MKKFSNAAIAIEYISSRADASSTIFVYDLAEHVGFGSQTLNWSAEDDNATLATRLQTRDGAGLTLVGRLSQGTSKNVAQGTAVTAYTTPAGLTAIIPSFSFIPEATSAGRLVLQVPSITVEAETLSLIPSLSGLSACMPLISEGVSIILSATAQESIELAEVAYRVTDSHVIHIFDHYSSSREAGHLVGPSLSEDTHDSLDLSRALDNVGLGFFDYAGDNEAHTAIVLHNGPLALLAKAFATRVPGVGVVVVRVLRPWDEEALRKAVPGTVRSIHVLDDVHSEAIRGPLFLDVLSAFIGDVTSPSIKSHGITPKKTLQFATRPSAFLDFIRDLVPQPKAALPVLDTPSTKKLLFVGSPTSSLISVPRLVEDAFITNKAIRARHIKDYDLFTKSGGVVVDRILLYPKKDVDEHVPVALAMPLYAESNGEVDFVAILDSSLLKSHALLHNVKAGSPVLVVAPWTVAELIASLPLETVKIILQRNLHVYVFDLAQAAEGLEGEGVEASLVDLAFLRLYLASAATEEVVVKVARATRPNGFNVDLIKANAQAWSALSEIEFSTDDVPSVDAPQVDLKHLSLNAILTDLELDDSSERKAKVSSWHRAAKDLLFNSAYNPAGTTAVDPLSQDPSLRPELPDRTFLVTCSVNRRLTPLEYDRNVFHLEFDTSNTGLTYEIGEALGVHGWNDDQEALDFCAWYGVDPQRLITLPVPGAEDRVHTRTVFQVLQQQVDLFGRPTKSFYTELAEYAKEKVDRYALLFIGSSEGVSTFKKLGEKETVTFADVLMRYPSARPGIEVLCQLIGDIKPRHYSIASAQAVVGDRVDLLIVAVDWLTPSGSPRYGQCTRYLAGLKPGQKVTVSIKPSVMKLPPNDLQPLIMAGLGTGAAPFRAFLQYKAWLAAQGKPIGPVYYYFGARHQSQEYLYGEEIEAFILDGVLTRAGLAFSRDGPKKVYIQSKMAEDGEALARMLDEQNGVFYLCGPTWPVGDVFETLVGSLVKYCGKEREQAAAYLEDLKEEERYVLEVY